jgi:hypothetical protein
MHWLPKESSSKFGKEFQTMTELAKNGIVMAVVAVACLFWLLSAIGAYLLLREVNENQLRGKPLGRARYGLLQALDLNVLSHRQKILRRCTICGIVGFLGGIFLCVFLKCVLAKF